MGVLACDRINCPHVMCDRLILDGKYYICNDCWDELLVYKESWNHKTIVRKEIIKFMEEIPPGSLCNKFSDIDEEFDYLTKSHE